VRPQAAGGGAPKRPLDLEAGARALEEIGRQAEACTRCGLHATRNRVVPGQGSPAAELVFVGEAPGADEDRQGLAFVGRAGQLLTKMVAAMGFSRDEVFICNVLKCRPPGNRDPRPEEAAACSPFLRAQLDVLPARVIIALGGHAMRCLLPEATSVGRMRGKVHTYHGVPLVITYHPAYLLRYEKAKPAAWSDLKLALRVIGREPPPRRR
jgi:uracil-DNA glycosylase family 4